MNTGIITSFVVGGILLISLLSLNSQVLRYSSTSTVDLINKERLRTIADLLENDFSKIGYNIPDNMPAFVLVQNDRIRFRADAFFNDNRPFSLITWEFRDNKAYTSSPNPNDYELTRSDNADSGSGNSERVFPVSYFSIEYLDQSGNVISSPTSNKEKIRQIRVEIICESLESSGRDNSGNEIYARTALTKTFHPENLQFLDY